VKGGKLLGFLGLAHCHPPFSRLHDGEIADRLEALITRASGDRDLITIVRHAPLSDQTIYR
jgi:hypothetical protein